MVIAPCFGLPAELFKRELKAYAAQVDDGRHYTFNIRNDTAGTMRPGATPQCTRTTADKYALIQNAAPLCAQHGRFERDTLQRRVRDCVQRHAAWLDHPPNVLREANRNYLWTMYLGAYNILAALPPAVGLDIPLQLWPDSDFLKHPLLAIWHDNFPGDRETMATPCQEEQQKP